MLDDDARTTIYRICQAAMREAVRLETVRRFTLRLALQSPADAPAQVALDIEFGFSPYVAALPPAAPLAVIRDRVLAEHGQYLVEATATGQRHRIAFRPAGP